MTPKQRLLAIRRARKNLKLADGFNPEGSHYKAVLEVLALLEKDALPPPAPPVPALGPLFVGGKSVLNQDCTHITSGIGWPAYDDAFSQGKVILAVEDMVVDTKISGANPGEAFYATGKSGIRYWYGHLDRNHPLGTKFEKGDAVGRVAPNNVGGGPHVHLGIDARKLLGHHLISHTNYTHGAPLIGVQLSGRR